ncbi:hypothetical protein ACFL2V_15850 [Pseudomonadota bacterium]
MSFKGLKVIALLCLGTSSLLANNIASAEEQGSLGKINGQTFTQQQLAAFARSTAPQADLKNPEILKQVVQGYVSRELLYQQAVSKNLDKHPAVQLALDEQRRAIIAKTLIGEITKANPIKEKDVRAFYDSEVKKRGESKNVAPYEKVRGQLASAMQERLVSAYIAELQKKAKLDIGK